MAKLFDNCERIVPTWREAARYLDTQPDRQALNLVLEISDPLTLTDDDRQVMGRVNSALKRSGLTLQTVAGTIFPIDFYRRYGRPAFYEHYKAMLRRGKKAGTWGTYASRMIDRPGRKAGEKINPLEMLVCRLRDSEQPERDGIKVSFQSAYELGVSDPEQDLARFDNDVGGEIPTYDASLDGKRWLGYPCLSHVSFKRVEKGDGHAVNLTAVYRSHHYCARALGNLLGLSQLLWFVAREAGLQVGTLTCISSYAELDVQAWGGIAIARTTLR